MFIFFLFVAKPLKENTMTTSNLNPRFGSLFQDLIELGVTKEELGASKRRLTSSAEKPNETQSFSPMGSY